MIFFKMVLIVLLSVMVQLEKVNGLNVIKMIVEYQSTLILLTKFKIFGP